MDKLPEEKIVKNSFVVDYIAHKVVIRIQNKNSKIDEIKYMKG